MRGLDNRGPIRRSAATFRGLAGAGAAVALAGSLVAVASGAGGAAGWTQPALTQDPTLSAEPDAHLLVSEVMTGGASASDEFIELYNPAAVALPLEGLELVYVSASGATVSRKAAWPAGAASVPAGSHLLVANESGAYAPIADQAYANGLAATGGSVALRIQGAATAIDAVGWGSAASVWLEGTPATAVAAFHSLERLPGGAAGSGQDTGDNIVDFFDQPVPDPQNATAPPIPVSPAPSASSSPGASATGPPEGTPSSTSSPTPTSSAAPPTPAPIVMSVAAARALPDGGLATIEGVSLTDGTFTDGGGYVADQTGGIAVLVSGGTFPRGQLLRVTGEVDDRYHQRTLRADASDVLALGAAGDPAASSAQTGEVGEILEGRLAHVSGQVISSATQLSGAVAYELDDGSGAARLVAMDGTGIGHESWENGTWLEVLAVVGQRDSSGTGSGGYRLLPRDPADVLSVLPPATASPSASATTSSGSSRSPGPSDDGMLVSIAKARQAPLNARVRVRGVVTLPTSLLHDGTAALQDGSGAIVLRLGDEAGDLALGDMVQVDGVRSTKSGMETLRVSEPPLRLGTQAEPDAVRHATGTLGEAQEAQLVVVRGAVATTPRRSSAENVYFDLDDGSGPLRVYVSPRAGVNAVALAIGSWLEITGVLGQETSGQQPERGHRLWPRKVADVRVIASVSGTAGSASGGMGGGSGQGAGEMNVGTGAPIAAGTPRPAIDLPAPALAARSVGRGSTAPATPLTDPSPEPVSTALAGGTDWAPMLALSAAILGGIGSFAAAPPGFSARLRALAARRRRPEPDPAEHETEGGSPLERTVARLVPLAVVDDGANGERVPSTGSRSAVRRILPPT